MEFFKKDVEEKMVGEEGDITLLNAMDAFKKTEEPARRNAIRSINEARNAGKMSCYIAADEFKPHNSLIKELSDQGYDLFIHVFKRNGIDIKDKHFVSVVFDGTTDGSIYFQNNYAKECYADFLSENPDVHYDMYN